MKSKPFFGYLVRRDGKTNLKFKGIITLGYQNTTVSMINIFKNIFHVSWNVSKTKGLVNWCSDGKKF